jgi:hypothetical protein
MANLGLFNLHYDSQSRESPQKASTVKWLPSDAKERVDQEGIFFPLRSHPKAIAFQISGWKTAFSPAEEGEE